MIIVRDRYPLTLSLKRIPLPQHWSERSTKCIRVPAFKRLRMGSLLTARSTETRKRVEMCSPTDGYESGDSDATITPHDVTRLSTSTQTGKQVYVTVWNAGGTAPGSTSSGGTAKNLLMQGHRRMLTQLASHDMYKITGGSRMFERLEQELGGEHAEEILRRIGISPTASGGDLKSKLEMISALSVQGTQIIRLSNAYNITRMTTDGTEPERIDKQVVLVGAEWNNQARDIALRMKEGSQI